MSEQDEDEVCMACTAVLVDGDDVYHELDGGYIHAKCCGPERDSYYGPDETPLGPNDPIPKPFKWSKP